VATGADGGHGSRFGGWKAALAAGLVGAVVGAGGMMAASGPFLRHYLLNNPEVIPEAMQHLQRREAARSVAASRSAIETPFAGAWAGAKDGDVVLIEFFDYACTFCRKSNSDVDRLLAEDRNLKVVWRDWPVLGPDSEAAARVSLAAARAGRFKPFHDALFAAGRPTPAAVEKAMATAGVPAEAAAQMKSAPASTQELRRNYALASQLRATGTPTFVVGDQVLQGAVGYEVLKQAIAEARAQS
jgi:protein-disulfide isomerase